MWVEKIVENNRVSFRFWAKYENGLMSKPRGEWPAEEVVCSALFNEIAEVSGLSTKDGKLHITVQSRPVKTLFNAAKEIAYLMQNGGHPGRNDLEELVAAFHREEENLNRLLTEIDKLPPPKPEIPYEMLLAAYDAAEGLADSEGESMWYWASKTPYMNYSTQHGKDFHAAMIAIRNWKKQEDERVGK